MQTLMGDGGRTSEPLSRDRIAAAALDLADREGLDALTMRRLGEALGVAAMSLYEYFPSKDALLDAIVEHAAKGLELPPADGDWRAQTLALANALLDTLERHPSGILIRRTRPMLSPAAMRTAERAMDILQGAGFEPEIAARTYRTVFLFTFAFAGFGGDSSMDYAAQIARLPSTEFPRAVAAADELAATMLGREQFTWAIERILDGAAIEAQR